MRQVLIIFNKNIYLFKKIIHNLYMSKFSIRKQVEELKEQYNNLNKTKKNSVPKKYSASKTEPRARIKELEATIEESNTRMKEYEATMSSTFNLMDIMVTTLLEKKTRKNSSNSGLPPSQDFGSNGNR